MTKVIIKSLLNVVVVFLLLPVLGMSQSNPQVLYKDIIDSEFHFSFISSAAPPVVLEHPSHGSFSLQTTPDGENTYNYTYAPGIAEGETQAVIEYYRVNEVTGALTPDYTTIYFRITPSLISCSDDRIIIEKNAGITSVDVLANDSRTDGPLVLESLLYSENGAATIINGRIMFMPDHDFVGDAFIYYSVKDQKGKKGSGLLKVKVVDLATIPQKKELFYISYGGEPVEIDLPLNGFKVNGNLSYGSFKQVDGANMYIPSGNQSTTEVFELKKDGITRKINVKMIYMPRPNSWVRDDVRYTTKGEKVTLDVTKNDLKKNQQIIQHSSDLVPGLSSGLFTYEPPSYYTGSRKMTYTVSDGYDSETGFVTVHVNNFNPQTRHDYEFLALGNNTLVINYSIPIEKFTFELIEAPERGSVVINDGKSTINFECDAISGNNLILYDPDYNYTGKDAFRVRYCVEGSCKNIEIAVDVVQNKEDICHCYTGCVWAGDANNDGVVNASDLISMASAFGESGADSDMGGVWLGRKTEDWNFVSDNGINAKFADSDGNGLVDEFDFDAIEENYNQNHALVPPQFIERRDFPFTIDLEKDTVYAGDLITFDIGIGNAYYPALEVNGLSYSLGFPPSFVDSTSFKVAYQSNSWFGIDEKLVSISKQIRKGWVESAVGRLSPAHKSGHGVIGKISFIVEEDVVGGFRVKNDGIIPLTIQVSDIQVATGDGAIGALDDTGITIYINVNKRSEEKENARLLVFPNPAQNVLNLHMNGGHEILSYQVLNINGQVVKAQSGLLNRSEVFYVNDLNPGVYILKANTTSGIRVERFEVLK
ncbi:Ig-like domain-containing protein [Portibacter marinus]|uniref:Ig-like domain-containing protein n=1 Tax=Portibacter marinus TaxID=2898660 RepID=UPI001F280191|nr:Ig-like domain-containing protein [Portibacter marinus]